MSHNLTAIICKHQEKFSTLEEKGYYFSVEMGHAILTVDYEHPLAYKGRKQLISMRTLGKELQKLGVLEYIYIKTDYGFGGGEQSACYTNFKNKDLRLKSINEGLKMLKIRQKQDQIDLYDSINLNHYRSEIDLMSEELKSKRKKLKQEIQKKKDQKFYSEWIVEFEKLTKIEQFSKISNLIENGSGYFAKDDEKKELREFNRGLEMYVRKNNDS